jgi:FlaA1/EpsC-like NDP-sugar epimerase
VQKWVLSDVGSWLLSGLTVSLTLGTSQPARELWWTSAVLLLAAVTQLFLSWRSRPTHLRLSSDLAGILWINLGVVLASSLAPVAITLWLATQGQIELLPVFIALATFVALSSATRAFFRRYRRGGQSSQGRPTLILGAGSLAEILIPQLLGDVAAQYCPIGLIDDDPLKRRTRISGVKVLGTRKSLDEIVLEHGASALIVCIANATPDLLVSVHEDCKKLGIEVIVLPPLHSLLRRGTSPSDLHALSVEDLIGRRQLEIESASISDYLRGKTVLVTGAGGSIGKELCAQIHRFSPARLVMVDRDETGLQEVQLSLTGRGLLDSDNLVLADIRDAEAVTNIFHRERPEVVFHAAALKHLPLLQSHPEEGWKTNVLGTLNVLSAAAEVDTQVFINVSTDKAASPSSVLGSTKLTAERLTSWFAKTTSRPYLSVRFGNVLGSRGSMLPIFASQIAHGGPVTVTHPEVTRYFMTIPEACELVLQAGALGEPSDVLILDMGEPVKIMDIAEKMVSLSGRKIEIVTTGLRPGEKLHEELYGTSEVQTQTIHPLIFRTKSSPLVPAMLDASSLVQ